MVFGMGERPPTTLAVLSNRGPVAFQYDDEGQLQARRAGGGLVAVLGPGVVKTDALWLATGISEAERAAAASGEVRVEGYRTRSVALDETRFRQYYDVIANQTLWFLVHGMFDLPRRPRFDQAWHRAWSGYESVNEQFAEAAAAELAPGATVVINDYHLALVPGRLRRLRPDVRSVAFLHTPFCQPHELDVLPEPQADAFIGGLAGGGACGFHSHRWAAAFEACCRHRGIRTPEVFVSPAVPDATELTAVAASAECEDEVRRLEARVGDRRFIVRVDRIELSKNLLRGFHAFDELLTTEPEWRDRVTFGAFIYPSRTSLAEYLGYRQEVEAVVRAVNAKWATAEWTPILLDEVDNYPRSVAALRRYDVLVVNPIRDGLNLVAKEGPIVNQHDGVLVLSPGAGAWDELGGHAVEAHPFDVSATATAFAAALSIPDDERKCRAVALRKAALARTPLDWFGDLLAQAR
jgi:trehalose 6-phosphate synthase